MYKNFFTYSNEPFCIINPAGDFLEINQAFRKQFGLTEESLAPEQFFQFLHPDDIEEAKNKFTKLENNIKLIKFANRCKNAQGVYRILEWSAHFDEEENVIYVIGRDVTEEKDVQNKYKHLLEVLRDKTIFTKTDPRGIISEVNDNFCEISGYEEEELLGKTHRVINSGFHNKVFFIKMWETLKAKETWSGTIINRRKDGSLYYVETIITPILNINGEIEEFLAIRYDITDKVQQKEGAVNIMNILNENASFVEVGGWELDIASGNLFWTEETFKILGVEKREDRKPILPEGIQLFIDEHQPIIDNAVNRGILYGEPYALELLSRTPAGEEKWVFTNGRPNYVDGKIVSLSGTIQNIHEKKLTEMRYQRERQKSIQNSKFAALGELSASIAHEINNPLGIISGYTELLQHQLGKDIPEKHEKKLKTILKSCERISHIVQKLKRFSRTDEVPEKEIINLKETLQEAFSLVSHKLERELIKFNTDLNAEPILLGNEIELEQVVINLINNAIDAVKHQETPWIDVSLIELEDRFELRVTDSGYGIPEEKQTKIFEPFYTTKKTNEGTGLGLSVVNSILIDHDASIHVNDKHVNTCFVITFDKKKMESPL